MTTRDSAVDPDELAVLQLIALDSGLAGGGKFSGPALADDLGVSNQTASRRLRRLEEAGLIERDVVSDGQWITITDDGERALREEYEKYRRVFERRARVELRGVLTGGIGEGRHYIHLPGYLDQFEDRLGYEPYPGTLNIDLDDESVRERAGLSGLDSIPIEGWEDEDRTYGPADCYPATIESPAGDRYETAHVVVPTRTHHAEDQLELVAPVNLRETLGLEDGDAVTVYVEASG